MKQFTYSGKPDNIQKVVRDNIQLLDYNTLFKLFRKKDVKVNGVRVAPDYTVQNGDTVAVYVPDGLLNAYTPVFSDDNIVIVNKRAGVETEGDNSLLSELETQYPDIVPVHRLDRNTRGLVVFARNRQAETELVKAFRDRTVKKYYLAQVKGVPKSREAVLKAYLIKDAAASKVLIYDKKRAGAREIITKYRVLEDMGDSSLLEVELITGATHQIRAHLAHIDYPVIGDGKYGDNAFNRKKGKAYQELTSNRMVFSFPDGPLKYLDKKEFTL